MKHFITILCSFIIIQCGFAQSSRQLIHAENTLISIYSKISRFASDSSNKANNTQFISLLDSVLQLPESFLYPFNDLKCGNVYAPDKTFRLITWNVIHSSGTYENFGFLQTYNKQTKKVKVYKLTDKSTTIKTPMLAICSPDVWYGASYYMVCQKKYKGQILYTLIGWNPNNTFTQKKVIETLKFDKSGNPVFGFPVIELKGKGFQRRIIFEYSSKNTMMLRYDEKKDMIVFDHLAPSDFRYDGIYEFYGPDFSIDAYTFDRGKWRYVSDIDIRNPRQGIKDYIPPRIKALFKKKQSKENPLGL
ncbi:MAG TPA: hypothetical protein P5243_03210 [Bacteroidales bacterium]|jgi:hypothetical protein|nr:hypothetical protein [Bacteroidales bacterium]HRS18490.1 hypothetical protein [Bacteroidales bacterium]